MATVVDEAIAAHDQFFREHDRGAGGVLREGVVLENISVRIHVVQAVADVVDEIVFDTGIVRERKINSVARIADFVAADQITFAIPLVNSVAAAIGHEHCVAIFRAGSNTLLDRLGGGGQSRFTLDAVVENLRAGKFFEVNAVKRIGDDAIIDLCTIAGYENGGIIIRQLQAGTGDAESAHCHIVRRDGYHVASAVAANYRAFFTNQSERFFDDDWARIDFSFKHNRLVRLGQVNALLKRTSSQRSRQVKRDRENVESEDLRAHVARSLRENQPANTMSRTERHSR